MTRTSPHKFFIVHGGCSYRFETYGRAHAFARFMLDEGTGLGFPSSISILARSIRGRVVEVLR